jgi:hypothetical protein
LETAHKPDDSIAALRELPAAFRDAFFGEMDYVALARKVS